VGVLIQKYCFTYPRKRFEVYAACIPSSIFFIVIPCGFSYPKILFYLPKKEVRSVCNLYTIFNIFFIVVPCGCTYPKYCFTYPRKRFEVYATCIPSSIFFYCDSMWVHLSKNIVLLTQERGSKCMVHPKVYYHFTYATCIPSLIFFLL
jgi:hypothetical protein